MERERERKRENDQQEIQNDVILARIVPRRIRSTGGCLQKVNIRSKRWGGMGEERRGEVVTLYKKNKKTILNHRNIG